MISKKDEVNVVLTGGLGNQLFQYAAAYKVAKILNAKKIKVFYSGFHFPKEHPKLHDLIKDLNLNFLSKSRNLLNLLNKFISYRLNCEIIVEKMPYYQNISKFNFKKLPVTLFGYFQHLSWYEDIIKDIIEKIYLHRPAQIDQLQNQKHNVICFRRADFTQDGWDLNFSYYKKSLDLLKIIPGDNLLLVGDEISFLDWVSNNFENMGYKVLKKPRIDIDDFILDFFIIGTSNKLILSNSSFHWWAGCLRESYKLNSKNVCYPSLYFPIGYFRKLFEAMFKKTIDLPDDHGVAGNPFGWNKIQAEYPTKILNQFKHEGSKKYI